MEFLKNPNYDFESKAKYFIALSIFFIGSGLAVMSTRGVNYGVEFSGGTQIIAQFQKTPEIDKVRQAVDRATEGELDTGAKKVLQSLAESYLGNPVVESSSEIVGPVVGAELRQKAIYLTVLGLAFQLIYIAVRFKGGVWGVAAAVASLHDVLICLGFLAFFRYEITLNVIAALLTLVGYSVNDTIVIFDRARENLRQRRKERLGKVLNDSVNQTLTRTLISNGTTFLSVLGLYLFGGEVLRGFGFTMVVGIVVGTYSTIFIAVPIVVFWSEFAQKRQSPPTARAAL